MDWKKVTLTEGWTIHSGNSETTLTAKFYAMKREDLPQYADFVCADRGSVNCVPAGFENFKISEVETDPLTIVGPYIASVTARPWLKSMTGRTKSLTSQTSFTMDIIEETVAPEISMKRKYSPFKKETRVDFVKQKISFMLVTAIYYVKKTKLAGAWGSFSGIVPKNSFPNWLKDLPGGNNRWRLRREKLEQCLDNDGRTNLYKVTRELLGIPDSFVDKSGNRMEWNQAVIGQRDWNDINPSVSDNNHAINPTPGADSPGLNTTS